MDEYEEYKKKVKVIERENKSHLKTFVEWLGATGISEKTIQNHVNNVDFYIDYFLTDYKTQRIEVGCYSIDEFLGDFFIRKALWSSCSAIKASAASIKKFYMCMSQRGIVAKEDYENLLTDIKIGMPKWLETMRRYDYDMDEDNEFTDII